MTSFSLASCSRCLSRDLLLVAINRNDLSLMLLMRSVAILILICLNIFNDSRWEYLLNDFENFLRNIKLYLMNDLFTQLCIAIFHSDIDCSECRLSHISSLRLSLRLRVMMMIFVRWRNRLRLFVTKKYEKCHEFSLKMISSVDKLFSLFSWFYTIRFIYDSIFWMNVLFLCAWWITFRLSRRIQMRHFFSVCIEFLILLCIN